MSKSLLALFCLVDGEATSKAFPVEIESTKTIGDLKKLIKVEKTPELDDIAADKLTLWRVSHPVIAANRHRPVLLSAIASPTELDPTDDICDLFDERPPKKSIHIIVQRPPPQADTSSTSAAAPLLSMAEVLNQVLPDLRYSPNIPDSRATTHSTFSRTPDEVLEWTEFPMQATSLDHPTTRRFQANHVCFNPGLVLSDEVSFSIALSINVYEILNHLLTDESRIGSPSEAGVSGQPDRVWYQLPQSARVLIEIKTNRSLNCVDLVTKYREDMGIFAGGRAPPNSMLWQVHQLFGYLSYNHLKHGVLTNYHQTYFVMRDAGKLWISPAIYHNNTGPTLLECYMYLIALANQGHTSPPAPPSPPLDPDDDDGDNGGGSGDNSNNGEYKGRKQHGRKQDQQHSSIVTRSKSKFRQIFSRRSIVRQLSNGLTVTVGKLYLNDFEMQEVLGEGRNGRVFRAVWRGEQVALKTCDLYKNPEYEDEMLTEMAVYEVLKTLQGVCIPRFKAAGYDGGLFVIAMELAGSPIEVDTLSHEERLRIVNNLSQIHQHGIAHNDIRPQNILVHRCNEGFQVRFIDFALSKRTNDKRVLKNEMVQLEWLLRPS